MPALLEITRGETVTTRQAYSSRHAARRGLAALVSWRRDHGDRLTQVNRDLYLGVDNRGPYVAAVTDRA